MGGDSIVYHDEQDSSLEEDLNFSLLSLARDNMGLQNVENKVNGLVYAQSSEENRPISSKLDIEVIERNRVSVYQQILQSYVEMKIHSKNFRDQKENILSYIPRTWCDKVCDYNVPKTICLILVGPRGSGKSTLVNRITKALEDDKVAPPRAQVSYNSLIGDENGTYFLQEYMIPRDSTSICLYDTRSLSCNSPKNENNRMLKSWMTKGVRNGELIVRKTDDRRMRKSLKCKAHKKGFAPGKIRKVNFVIYVVNGLSVLKALENIDDSARQYTETIVSTFNCPYLSFKDDKPALVFTHGDLLSLSDQARVRAYLEELLGIPPTKQVFDIPDYDDLATDTSIIEMLRYTLEHADRNLHPKKVVMNKIHKASISLCMILLILVVGVAIAISHNKSCMRKDHDKCPKVKVHKVCLNPIFAWKIGHAIQEEGNSISTSSHYFGVATMFF